MTTALQHLLSIPKVLLIAWFLTIPQLIEEISKIEERQDAISSALNPAYIHNTIEEFDYVIIGAGSAGAVVANRLSKRQHLTILVIQDGGNPNVLIDVPAFEEDVKHQQSTDYYYKVMKQKNACLEKNGQGCIYSRGIGLGGSSNLYHMTVTRANPQDYNLWASLTNDSSWAFENVVKVFKHQEDYHGFYESSDLHGTGGENYVSSQQPAVFNEYFNNAMKELGLPLIDANSNLGLGYGHVDVNVKNGIRWGSYQAFLKPILGRPNLHIYRYARATKIHFSKTMRATGVTYVRHGSPRFVKAKKEVILCAGAIDSPKLLMLSGIGPKKNLKSLKIKLLLDLPVGQNLQDHITVRIPVLVNKTGMTFIPARDLNTEAILSYFVNGSGPLAIPDYNPAALAYITTLEFNDTTWPDIEILGQGDRGASVLPNGDYLNSVAFIVCLFRPFSRGKIKLASKNPYDPPIINPKHLSNDSDMRRLIEGAEFIVKLVETTKAFQSINASLTQNTKASRCEKHAFKTKKYWECYIRHTSFTLSHPVGTVRMGVEGDPKAVVDSELRVLGTEALRVIDASIIPIIPTGHTHTPTMMIGEVGSQFIIKP